MRPPILNVLTPWGWAAAGVAALVSLVLLAGAAGFRWDPLRLTERRLERTRAELAVARSDTAARRIEQAAEAGQGARLDAHHRQSEAAARLSAVAETEARKAPDAQTPLDPDRARRLRELDRRLCGLAPDLSGCAAAPGPAARGDAAVRPGGAARGGDLG